MNQVKAIKILNKNNDNIYYPDEAPIFTDVKNETLDSGTIIISNQTEKILMEPYDIVSLIDKDGDSIKYMCIDTYSEIMTCVNPKIYRYEISLFSETKQLEGIILPNLRITKVWEQSRSIGYYIKQYMDEYCPQVRTVSGSSYTFSPKWIYLDSSTGDLYNKLANKFNNVECPEMQWNTPTLREVLNDLMMVVDCIPVLQYGRLDFIDLTEVNNKNWNNDKHVNYVTRTRSSEDYVSELQVKLENVTNNLNDTNNIVNRVEYFPLTISDNEATMQTTNFFACTRYPIYKLKSFKLMVPIGALNSYGQDTDAHSWWYEQDLMDITEEGQNFSLVLEYQDWVTKNLDYLNVFNATPPAHLYDWAKYQSWTLYYTRGSNEISNFNAQLKYAVTTYALWEQLLIKIVRQIQGMPPGAGPYNLTPAWNGIKAYYYNMVFRIEYETLEGCLFRASKNELPDNERIVIDNQTNSYVDSYNQGFLEYQKANRLGNEQLQINARFDASEDDIMEIGDMFDDCVIYQCQYQYFRNHVEVNALATKNYILREYFTGVKSKIRSWRIASGSEALTRHDLLKYYCEFSYNPHIEQTGLTTLVENNIAEYFVSSLTNYNVSPLKTCFVRTEKTEESTETWYPSSNQYYIVDLLSRVIGNSLVFTFGFQDNYWAGKSFDTDIVDMDTIKFDGHNTPVILNSALQGGGVPMKQHRYTDDNGECDSGHVIFGNGVKISAEDVDCQPGDTVYGEQTRARYFLYNIFQRPVVNETNVSGFEQITTDFNFKKDSQEITNISTQFEFSTDTTNICFTKEWIKRQQAISTNSNSHTYKAYFFDKSKYDFRRPDILPTGGTNLTVTFTFPQTVNSSIGIKCEFNNLFYTEGSADIEKIIIRNNKCVYITDENNTVLFAFKNIPNNNFEVVEKTISDTHFYNVAVTLYLNILKTRNKNIYGNNNHYLIISEI